MKMKSPDVVCLGELLIDFVSIDRDVPLSASGGFHKAAGGAPANVAAGVAKLGGSAGFIGKVGDDPFGHFLKQTLEEARVDTRGLAFDREARTTLSFVARKPDGERECMFYRHPGADMRLAPSDIDEAYIAGARTFHYGSISLGSPSAKQATLQAIDYARKHGLLISYDPNLRLDLWPDRVEARVEIDGGFRYADVVKISEEEYAFITGCRSIEECARYILDRGPRLVVVTMGEKGCYYATARTSGYAPGYPVEPVDTTGAGDAFVAAMLTAFGGRLPESEEELARAMAYANGAGALAATGIGAIPSMPTAEQVRALIGAETP